jgi:hypothetical protein
MDRLMGKQAQTGPGVPSRTRGGTIPAKAVGIKPDCPVLNHEYEDIVGNYLLADGGGRLLFA